MAPPRQPLLWAASPCPRFTCSATPNHYLARLMHRTLHVRQWGWWFWCWNSLGFGPPGIWKDLTTAHGNPQHRRQDTPCQYHRRATTSPALTIPLLSNHDIHTANHFKSINLASTHIKTPWVSPSAKHHPHNLLSTSGKERVQHFSKKFSDVFGKDLPGYNGSSGQFVATINMGSTKPLQHRSRFPNTAITSSRTYSSSSTN